MTNPERKRGRRLSTCIDRLCGSYGTYLRWSIFAAVVIHGLLAFLVFSPSGSIFEAKAEEMKALEIPPEVEVPPRPVEDLDRPKVPETREKQIVREVVVAETEVVEEITENTLQPEPPPPAPPPPPEDTGAIGDEFTFTPFTERPECRENCGPKNIIQLLPSFLRDDGVSCSLVLGLRVETDGRVSSTQILQSSGVPGCDAAAERWAGTTRWTTGYNRDEPVVVWMSQPITIETR